MNSRRSGSCGPNRDSSTTDRTESPKSPRGDGTVRGTIGTPQFHRQRAVPDRPSMEGGANDAARFVKGSVRCEEVGMRREGG